MGDLRQDGGRGAGLAIILGTSEIASAVAVGLFRAGFGVVLSHDPAVPVIRRKMAFHDALYDDGISVDGVVAHRADNGMEVRTGLARGDGVVVSGLGLLDLIVLGSIDVLVDARLDKYQTKPDLRRLGRLAIGLGPGFAGGANCDLAIETRPGLEGRILQHGATEPADGKARPLGGQREQRFVRADFPGRWHTAIEIGTRVYKDFLIGHLGSAPVRAPFDGILRGVVRDGTEVPAGVKLLELDPRGRDAEWTRPDERSCTIAAAVMRAMSFRGAVTERQRAARVDGER